MRIAILAAAAALSLSACVATTAIETGRAPTPAELQQQLAADVAALKGVGCVVDAGAQVVAIVDPTGQRVAQVKTASGDICAAPSPAAAPIAGQ